jgi:hypothetical protein
MKEVKLYGSLLFVLLIGAYFSYTREEPAPGTTEKVTILDVPKESLKKVELYGKTSTVAISFKTDEQGKEYSWFVVEQNKKTRGFVGNDKVDKMLETFAPFKAIRSLGKLSADEIKETKLDPPERKLVLTVKSEAKEFDVGGRTSGARDHYVRTKGGQEVFLVASSVLGDLEFPEGRFMQRKLYEKELKDVEKITLMANGKAKSILHRNRLAATEAFWASEAKPDEKSETLGNFVDKLDKLVVSDYPNEAEKFPREGTPIVEVTFFGEDEAKPLGNAEIWRVGDDKKAEYYAFGTTTHMPVKLNRATAEQIERDLATALAD